MTRVQKTFNKWEITKQQLLYREKTKDATYSQNWPSYNWSQTQEKILFYKLLDELLSVVPERTYTFGRPRLSFRDMIFCCMIKTYLNTSARRTMSDIKLAKDAAYINCKPHFNTLLNYFHDSGMRILLHYLIEVSALPLKVIDSKVAIDSSGWGTKFDRWMEIKHGKRKDKAPLEKCRKVHIVVGTQTNVVIAVEITKGNTHDSKLFNPLITKSTQHFNFLEVLGDKAYLSRENLQLVSDLGATPFIPFKSNSSGKGEDLQHGKRCFKCSLKIIKPLQNTIIKEVMWNQHSL